MTEEKEFDVVLYALQQHRNRLWKMTQQNMNSEYIGMNIMDDIRLQQIDELDKAIKERTTPPQRKPLTDEELRVIENKINPNMRWRSSDEEGITLYPIEYYELVRAIEAAHGIKGLV